MRNPWIVLGIEPTEDKKIIKKAYSQKLKTIDRINDLESFQELKQAFDAVMEDSTPYLETISPNQYETDEIEDSFDLLPNFDLEVNVTNHHVGNLKLFFEAFEQVMELPDFYENSKAWEDLFKQFDQFTIQENTIAYKYLFQFFSENVFLFSRNIHYSFKHFFLKQPMNGFQRERLEKINYLPHFRMDFIEALHPADRKKYLINRGRLFMDFESIDWDFSSWYEMYKENEQRFSADSDLHLLLCCAYLLDDPNKIKKGTSRYEKILQLIDQCPQKYWNDGWGYIKKILPNYNGSRRSFNYRSLRHAPKSLPGTAFLVSSGYLAVKRNNLPYTRYYFKNLPARTHIDRLFDETECEKIHLIAEQPELYVQNQNEENDRKTRKVMHALVLLIFILIPLVKILSEKPTNDYGLEDDYFKDAVMVDADGEIIGRSDEEDEYEYEEESESSSSDTEDLQSNWTTLEDSPINYERFVYYVLLSEDDQARSQFLQENATKEVADTLLGRESWLLGLYKTVDEEYIKVLRKKIDGQIIAKVDIKGDNYAIIKENEEGKIASYVSESTNINSEEFETAMENFEKNPAKIIFE